MDLSLVSDQTVDTELSKALVLALGLRWYLTSPSVYVDCLLCSVESVLSAAAQHAALLSHFGCDFNHFSSQFWLPLMNTN